MPDITFTEQAWDEYLSWQQDKQTVRRINALLREITRTPFEGTGKPEPLKHNRAGEWSRRINETDRLVYKVQNGSVIVLQCKGHYSI